MIESASHTYLVVDSTKIGRKAFASLGSIEFIDTLITNDGITTADRKVFEKANIEVIIA
jgi:DeoR/GlpR family transcriptional regulator of sugar metabolism